MKKKNECFAIFGMGLRISKIKKMGKGSILLDVLSPNSNSNWFLLFLSIFSPIWTKSGKNMFWHLYK